MSINLRTAPVARVSQEVSLVGLDSITVRGCVPRKGYQDITINRPSRLIRRKDGKVTIRSHALPDQTVTLYGPDSATYGNGLPVFSFIPLMARMGDQIITEFIL